MATREELVNESEDLAIRRREARRHGLNQDLEELGPRRAACEQHGDAEGVAAIDRRWYKLAAHEQRFVFEWWRNR